MAGERIRNAYIVERRNGIACISMVYDQSLAILINAALRTCHILIRRRYLVRDAHNRELTTIGQLYQIIVHVRKCRSTALLKRCVNLILGDRSGELYFNLRSAFELDALLEAAAEVEDQRQER